MIDHKELLKKYIGHVVDCEGVEFIHCGNNHSEVVFTEEEWRELELLAKELGR